MTINRGISLMHLLLKLWNGFVIVRSIVYIVCKTVITVEFPNAKYRRKQIKVHLNLPVEKMGHLYRVIKQHVNDILNHKL
jgi:hypothetical protein